jgi:hypothetical protein
MTRVESSTQPLCTLNKFTEGCSHCVTHCHWTGEMPFEGSKASHTRTCDVRPAAGAPAGFHMHCVVCIA